MSKVIYFSNVSENTLRFVKKLGVDAKRIGLRASDSLVIADEPYVLITPTYGSRTDGKAVPKQVIRFLNHEPNRLLLRGVIGSGNLNFGKSYSLAATEIAKRCQVPVLARFELAGTTTDINHINKILENH